ncbi:MAG: hypothetical protein N2037_13160, partial [Acidimicrobiales bacterium]|nr:hypothetical protein [Acidimicrobiales bacterium]
DVYKRQANCSLYPLGSVEVLVAEDDLNRAQELLLIDEIEDALSGLCTDGRHTRDEVRVDWPLGVILMALAAGFLLYRLLLS